MTTADIAPLIYRAYCRIIDQEPRDYATLPDHRHARWERVAEHWVRYTNGKPWTFGQCLYEAVHVDAYATWHRISRDDQTLWKAEAIRLVQAIGAADVAHRSDAA